MFECAQAPHTHTHTRARARVLIQWQARDSETSAGYCFISFKTVEEAEQALEKLNGEPIPNTKPVSRLKHAVCMCAHACGYAFFVHQ